MELSNHLSCRGARLSFTILMLWCWCGGGNLLIAAAQPVVNAPAMSRDRKRLVDNFDRVLQALEAADNEVGRDGYEPKALAEKLKLDPIQIFNWVRDNTWWVPYRGALRGPSGVLMDRVGSSLDRSLLLAELVRCRGAKVRLVHAVLTAEQASDLIGKIREVPKSRMQSLEDATDDASKTLLEQYARRFILDPRGLQSASEKGALQTTRLAEAIAGRVAEQTGSLEPLLSTSVPDEAEIAASSRHVTLTAAQDHWWVQVQEGGAWVDWDPMLPDAKPGARVTAAHGEPLEYTGKLPSDAALCHEVQIQVIVETWSAGKLSQTTVLKQTLRPSDVLGRRVALTHVPTHWPEDFNLFKSGDAGQAIKEVAQKQHEWVPILNIGTETVTQAGFDDTGHINKSPKFSPMAKAGASANAAAADVQGALAPVAPKPLDDGVLTAEWIEYQINSPGQGPATMRRELFDLLGPARRGETAGANQIPKPNVTDQEAMNRSFSTLGETEILLLPCELSRSFFRHVRAEALLANRKTLMTIAGKADADATFSNEVMNNLVVAPGKVYELAIERAACSPVRADVYLDRPNILSQHRFLRMNEDQTLLESEAFDVVSNDVAVRRDLAGGLRGAKSVRMQQGLTDTAAEACLGSGTGLAENASELLATSAVSGEQWVTIHKEEELSGVSLPQDTVARIKLDLADGYVVMVPKKPMLAGGNSLISWWRIDPKTGHTLGIGHQGWGASLLEQALVVARIMVKCATFFFCIGKTIGAKDDLGLIFCVVIAGAGVTGVLSGGAAGSLMAYVADFLGLLKIAK